LIRKEAFKYISLEKSVNTVHHAKGEFYSLCDAKQLNLIMTAHTGSLPSIASNHSFLSSSESAWNV